MNFGGEVLMVCSGGCGFVSQWEYVFLWCSYVLIEIVLTFKTIVEMCLNFLCKLLFVYPILYSITG